MLKCSLLLKSNRWHSFRTYLVFVLTSAVTRSMVVISQEPASTLSVFLRLTSDMSRSLMCVTAYFILLAASNISGVTWSSFLNNLSSSSTFYRFFSGSNECCFLFCASLCKKCAGTGLYAPLFYFLLRFLPIKCNKLSSL